MTYFITESYLKTNTPITKNVDVTDVAPYIRPTAEMRLMPILGTYFYNYMLSGYNAQTLNNDEEDLVEKIQPVVAWRSAEQAVFGLSYQLKNKGLQSQFGDYSNNVSEVAFAMEHYGQMAAFFEKRLISWLLDNKDLFPEFISDLNKDSDIKPVDDCRDDDYDNTMMVI
jgi:hypothetical protein